MNKIRKYTERWLPLVFAFVMVLIFYKYQLFTILNPIFNKVQDLSLIIPMVVFFALTRHKNTILLIDTKQHRGFQKLSKYPKLQKRFFAYLNYCMYHSIILMLYNVLCMFDSSLFDTPLVVFSTIYLLCQYLRFSLVFNVACVKNIKNV